MKRLIIQLLVLFCLFSCLNHANDKGLKSTISNKTKQEAENSDSLKLVKKVNEFISNPVGYRLSRNDFQAKTSYTFYPNNKVVCICGSCNYKAGNWRIENDSLLLAFDIHSYEEDVLIPVAETDENGNVGFVVDDYHAQRYCRIFNKESFNWNEIEESLLNSNNNWSVEKWNLASITQDFDLVPSGCFPKLSIDIVDSVYIDSLKKEGKTELAINEIYARYGMIFSSKEIDSYFRQKDWYEPKIEKEYIEEFLTNIEKENIKMIKY